MLGILDEPKSTVSIGFTGAEESVRMGQIRVVSQVEQCVELSGSFLPQ